MWYVNYYHIQVLVLELAFCLNMQKRDRFRLRFVPTALIYVLLPFLVPGSLFSPEAAWGWFTVGFLIMLLLSVGLLELCFRMNLKQLILYGWLAQTLQHMIHCLGQIMALLGASEVSRQMAEFLLLMGGAILAMYLSRNRLRSNNAADMKPGYLLIFAVVSTIIVDVVSFWSTSQEVNTLGEQFFDLFSCSLLLSILMDIFRMRAQERTELLMSRLLKQEQEQHRMNKAAMEVINRKCHDLKHQISALRRMESSQEREQSIRELERSIMLYDSFVRSGLEDMDIILAEKSMAAEEKGVTLNCMVDGKLLAFMKIEDLYSLLGNALDNAIEAASGQSEEDRIIMVKLFKQAGAAILHVENVCRKQPLFADGLPITTKKDTEYHGLGMKSMRYVAQKYCGELQASWDSGRFSLDILLPLPDET